MSRTVISALALAAAFGAAMTTHVVALELDFPGPAEPTAHRGEPLTTFRLPIGPFAGGTLPTQLAEGALDQTAFRIALDKPSTLELIAPLRDQLAGAGFDVLFECETDACGGYDFRYGTDLLPEPDMHVDLGDFRYLAAKRQGTGGDEFVSLVVSRSAHDGYVQLTRIGRGVGAEPVLSTSTKSPPKLAKPDFTAGPKETAFALPVPGRSVPGLADLGKRLELGQSQVLEDLVFASGSSALAEGDYVSLDALADWLKADTQRKVTIVGHTDASGSLAGNLSLSKLRAESVRQRLLFDNAVAPEQVMAEGVGYLAPRDSNQTEEGRKKNRRVEVMPTSTKLIAP